MNWPKRPNYLKITTTYMNIESTSTARSRRLRARRSRGVVMVAPVEVGEGGVELLKQHQAADRGTVGEACLAALSYIKSCWPDDIRRAHEGRNARP